MLPWKIAAGKPRMKTWTSREYPRNHFTIPEITSPFRGSHLSFHITDLLSRPDVKTSHAPSVPILPCPDGAISVNPNGAQGDRTMVPLEWSFSSRLQGRDLDSMFYGCSLCIEIYVHIIYYAYIYIYKVTSDKSDPIFSFYKAIRVFKV